MRRVALIAILLVLPVAAAAGAWPRGKGETFVSLSAWSGYGGSVSLYGERGMTRRLTFGTKIERLGPRRYSAEGFVRLNPLPDAGWQAAIELGYGSAIDQSYVEYGVSLTHSAIFGAVLVGRGVETPWGAGWIDLRAERGRFGILDYTELNATLGIALTPRHGIYAEINRTIIEDGQFTSITPTYVLGLTDTFSTVVGWQHPLVDGADGRLKIGLWAEF